MGIAEHSGYVKRSTRGTGVGRLALENLCRLYTDLGFWKLVSRIFPENTASLALHDRVGSRVVGVYRRHGQVDGVWRDCVIVEKLLGHAAETPLESDVAPQHSDRRGRCAARDAERYLSFLRVRHPKTVTFRYYSQEL